MIKGIRKQLAAVTAAILLGLTGITNLPAAALSENENYYLGDLDGNNAVDVLDIIMLQKQLMNLPVQLEVDRVDLADIDRNDEVDIFDLGYLKKLVLGTAKPEDFLPEPPPEDTSLYDPVTDLFDMSTPSVGTVKMLSIFVDFADVKYSDQKLSVEALQQELFGTGQTAAPYESITAWYDRASYGNLHIEGDCAYYTCSGRMADYMYYDEDGEPLYETMIMEVLQGLDDQIDFSQYDANDDSYIDCISIAVPLDNASYEEEQFWWGCTATWYENPYFHVDNKWINNYIIMDQSPYADSMRRFKSTIVHEMGHSIGMPDYYVYGDGDHYTSGEGLRGDAGLERMDDSVGDFCSFTKLMFGWLQKNQVQWYEGSGEQSFRLSSISEEGSCVILPINSEPGDLTSEYFIIEYLTPVGNNTEIKDYAWFSSTGVRIFHVCAELYTDLWDRTYFKYDNFGENFQGYDKYRVLRLVNDGDDRTFYRTGDVCRFGTENFAGYDASGYQTVNTGYTVSIGEMNRDGCTVTVTRE